LKTFTGSIFTRTGKNNRLRVVASTGVLMGEHSRYAFYAYGVKYMNTSRQNHSGLKEEFGKQHPARQLADMMSRLYAYGLTTTSGGNLSIKDEAGAVWITPGSIDKSCLQPEDIIRIDADGTVSGKHKPSIETKFHTNIAFSCKQCILH